MPPRKEPCCLWIFSAEDSSEKMLLKERVLMPVGVLCVLLPLLLAAESNQGVKCNLPVHRITLPHNNVAALLHRFNVRAKHRLHLIFPIASDQRNLANLLVGVHNIQ